MLILNASLIWIEAHFLHMRIICFDRHRHKYEYEEKKIKIMRKS